MKKENKDTKKRPLKESDKEEPEEKEERKISEKILVKSFIVLIVVLLIIFSLRFIPKPEPKTLDELHKLNLQGKLKQEEGYIYNGLSFVKFDDMWYTSIKSPSGRKIFNLALRYGPKELETLTIEGNLNTTTFNLNPDYYVTFNPLGNDFSHVAAAVNDFNQHMINAFNKIPIPACDKNETDACKNVPIINCTNTEKPVLYIKEAPELKVKYLDNCILVEGYGFDLIKGVDRVIMDFYGIMK